MNGSWPLTENDLQGINAVLGTEQMLRPLLNKCKECGLPCDDEIATLDHQIQHCQQLKSKFFPDKP
jgi:hypothetical protein